MRVFFIHIGFLVLFFCKITAQELEWENQLQVYFEKNKPAYFTKFRFYTYLYIVQNAALTYPSIVQDYIAERLSKRFFPDFIDFPVLEKDPHVENLADNVLCPFLARISLEDSSTENFTSNKWPKYIPQSTQQIAKWIPWSFPIPEPPPPLVPNNLEGWSKQFDQLKKIRQNLTEHQRDLLKTWVGNHGKEYEWRVMANRYMQEHHTSYAKTLLVRATLMMALYDGLIAEMRAKYMYCVPRPYMMDPSFKPLIPELNSPSYPSGHAIQSAIFAGILSYFFPEDISYWHYLDQEGSSSRLWAGVHFPEDIEQGHILGQKVTTQLLRMCLQVSSILLPCNDRSSFLNICNDTALLGCPRL